MVKGYDPTQTDVAAFLLNYLFQIRNKDPKITITHSEKLIRNWLKNSTYTSRIYQQFKQLNLRPSIKLKQKCSLATAEIKDQPDQYYPTTSTDDKVVICLNNIRNKLELKEHLDRELTFFYLQKKTASIQQNQSASSEQKEKQLVHNIYESCYSGYKNYMLQDKTTKDLALICSKYLFFRKTQSNLPIDRLFRYSTRLTQEILL